MKSSAAVTVGIFDPEGDAADVKGSKTTSRLQTILALLLCESFLLLIKNRNSKRAEVFVTITEGRIRRQLYEIYEGWNFNFGNTLLDWIQELPE